MNDFLAKPLTERLRPEERVEYAAHRICSSVEDGELGYSLDAVKTVLTGLVAQSDGSAPSATGNEIMLYGEIGASPMADLAELLGIELRDNSAKSVNEQLAEMKGDVTVRIFSYGGNYQESVAIGQAFDTYRRRTGARITTQVDAMAASAAAFIALRGDDRKIDSLGTMLFHEIRASVKRAPATVLENIAAEMRKMNAPLAAFVAGHTALTLSDYEKKVADGKDWTISAQEAEKVAGFEILDAGEKDEKEAEVEAPGDHFERDRAEASAESDEDDGESLVQTNPSQWDDLVAMAANF